MARRSSDTLKRKAAILLARGETRQEAADAVGRTRNRIDKWLYQDPKNELKQMIEEEKDQH